MFPEIFYPISVCGEPIATIGTEYFWVLKIIRYESVIILYPCMMEFLISFNEKKINGVNITSFRIQNRVHLIAIFCYGVNTDG